MTNEARVGRPERAGFGGGVSPRRLWDLLEGRAAWMAAAIACATAAGAIRWGSFVAGGSDSYCYIAQAVSFAEGRLLMEQPLARVAPWPDAIRTLTPGGFRPSPVAADAIVPICPPGLALTLAPLWRLFGSAALPMAFPAFGAAVVWFTFVTGRRVGSGRVGLMAASLVAASPVFLYQVVQPMSDVPAAAWWMAATALALAGGTGSAVGAGAAASMAVLTRPNLAPLAAMVVAFAWANRRRAAVVALATLPGFLAIAALQAWTYGSPFASGYGSAADIFDADRVPINLRHYLSWLIETETPIVLLALVAPLLRRVAPARQPDGPGGERPKRHAAAEGSFHSWLLLSFFAITLACYLPYLVFDDWWYVRFLLPALPHLLVLCALTLVFVIERLPVSLRAVAFVAVTTVVAATYIGTARDRSAFRLYDLERRFRDGGLYVAAHTPPRTIVITSWQSGSVRHYGGRPSVLWDGLDPKWLDPALDFLRGRGYIPLLLLESWEEPAFRARFEGRSEIGGLDWPPSARIGQNVRIYNPADRPRYMAGGVIRTEQVWPR